MVTFKQIQNIDGLFDMLNGCVGAVFLTSSDGVKIDIRNNPLIRELITNACQKSGVEKLDLEVENDRDMPLITDYLIGRVAKLSR